MTTALTTKAENSIIEKVIIEGDLSQLSPGERLNYYRSVCDSLGLNPLTKPFDYIRLNNRLVLYAKRDATDQLRKIHGVSVSITSRERIEDVYVVSAKATTKDGREDESIGAVNILNLKGDSLANALMKAETKAKRRVTLSIVGLGWLDETEIETIPDARPVVVDVPVGEVIDQSRLANGAKVIDPMTRYWSEVKAAGFTREKGLEILTGANNDPSRAIDVILGIDQTV